MEGISDSGERDIYPRSDVKGRVARAKKNSEVPRRNTNVVLDWWDGLGKAE